MNMVIDDKTGLTAHSVKRLSLLQLESYEPNSRRGTDEATLSELPIQNELFAAKFRYAYLPIMRARVAPDDFHTDSERRNFLTSFPKKAKNSPMKISRNPQSPFSPVARLSFAGYLAYRGNFMPNSHTITSLSYATLTHKATSYILSAVEGKCFRGLKRPFCAFGGPCGA